MRTTNHVLLPLTATLTLLLAQAAPAQSIRPFETTNIAAKNGFAWKAAPGLHVTADASFVPVNVPANLSAEKPGNQPLFADTQTATYSLRFHVPELGGIARSIRLGEISDRDKVYLNGTLIGETGAWNAQRAQAYDKVRIYEIQNGVLRQGENELVVQVQGIIKGELGIYRDDVELGPTTALSRDFYLKNIVELLTLAMYGTVGAYFLLFFVRRRHDIENLFFSLFMFGFVVYSFQRTQLKYELGIEFYYLKKSQTLTLLTLLPFFYYFVRTYYHLPKSTAVKIMDWFFLIYNVVPIALGGAILFSASADFWNFVINTFIQPSWIPHVIGILIILGVSAAQKDRDAWIMIGATLVLIVTIFLDILTGQALINLPTLTTYTFTLFVFSMASILANRFVRLHNETESLNAELSRFNAASRRFVPFEFLRELGKESIVEVELGDQAAKEMTVLFSDIRSFTTLSESMTPKENFDFINSYLRRVGPVIRDNHGFIDKYIGDAVMALFSQSPDDAMQASIEMQNVIRTYNVKRAKFNYKPIAVGVGLHKGKLMLGTIGESERMEGTVISDAVNLASRIESLTKTYSAAILSSEETLHAFKDPTRYRSRFVDRVIVKGKNEPVALYEFLDGLSNEEAQRRLDSVPLFQSAYREYSAGRFKEAEALFAKMYAANTNDKTASLYVERCKGYQLRGTPQNWDGVEALTSK